MNLLEAIILGIIQGLTEFLPVSSSGHLELGKVIFGNLKDPDESLLFTIVVHAATALATVTIFWRDVAEIFRGLFQFRWNEATRFSLKIILSMVPALFVGLLLKDEIEALFDGNLLLVGSCLLVTGALLFLADLAKRTDKPVSFPNALLIGIAQAIAILPGISRSGATISTSVLLGIDRERAARFSFLMVVPLILGAMAKDLLEYEPSSNSMGILPLALGFVAAFITGLFACRWMIALVKRSQLRYFAFYCFFVGGIALTYTLVYGTA